MKEATLCSSALWLKIWKGRPFSIQRFFQLDDLESVYHKLLFPQEVLSIPYSGTAVQAIDKNSASPGQLAISQTSTSHCHTVDGRNPYQLQPL